MPEHAARADPTGPERARPTSFADGETPTALPLSPPSLLLFFSFLFFSFLLRLFSTNGDWLLCIWLGFQPALASRTIPRFLFFLLPISLYRPPPFNSTLAVSHSSSFWETVCIRLSFPFSLMRMCIYRIDNSYWRLTSLYNLVYVIRRN